NKRYQLLSELSGEFLFEYDFEYDRLTMSERTVRAFGGEPVQNHLYRRLVSAKNEYSEWMLPLLELLKKERSAVVERQVLLPDGRTTWLRITVVTVKDAAGHLNSAVGKITDIQAEKEEMDELSMKAQTDGLTGLYNAVTAREMIERALGKGGTMLMMDVDQFKSINDRFGHYTGDQILQNVAALLRKVFRDEDIIGRLGGDEFIVFLRGVSQKTVVEERCRKLREELSLCSAAWTVQVTISIGAAVADSGSDYAMLYRRADDALYNVKAVGRNGFH
ncbi:MAG: GGDEF domain-containing protein, partial [Pseudoflavonifractor sp.]